MKFEHKELIQLHITMTEHFSKVQIHQISYAMFGIDYNDLDRTDKRDVIRELLLAAQRRCRIPDLIDLCQQMQANFNWQERDLSALYKVNDIARCIDPEQLFRVLTKRFDVDDLRQLCFYLDIDFEEVKGPHLLWNTTHNLSDASQRWLYDIGIDHSSLCPGELDVLLKEMWTRNFFNFCLAEGIWEQMVTVCFWLCPDAFSTSE